MRVAIPLPVTRIKCAARIHLQIVVSNLLILCCGFLFVSCASIEPPGSREVASIDTTVEPLNTDIANTEVFFQSIFTNSLKKSEFETQSEYQHRLRSYQPPAETFFFQVDSGLVEYSFNAERQRLVAMLPPAFTLSTQPNRRGSVFTIQYPRSKIKDERRRQYELLGSLRDVCQIHVLNFLELPINTRWKKLPDSYEVGLGLGFPIPSAKAKAAVEGKEITLVIGVTIGDLYSEGGYTAEYSAFDSGYTIPVRVTHLKALSVSTGQVIASWSKDAPVKSNTSTIRR